MFKPGDQVRTIRPTSVKIGTVGVISSISEDNEYIRIKGESCGYTKRCFELVSSSTNVQSKVDISHTCTKGSTLVYGKPICKDCGGWL